jgi:hypothetical protein
MKTINFCLVVIFSALFSEALVAEGNNVQVETTRIKANKELPKVLYLVPWKEMESTKNAEQKLVIHDFFGDLYDPVLPSTQAPKTTGFSPSRE